MRTWQRIAGITALLAGTAMTAGVAEAGEPPPQTLGNVEISVIVLGLEAENVDDWRPELYVDGTDEAFVLCGPPVDGIDDPLFGGRLYDCPVTEETTFTLGFPTPPENYQVDFQCGGGLLPVEAFEDDDATFTIDGETSNVFCEIYLWTNMVFVDKAIADEMEGGDAGGAETGDFVLELYDSEGNLVASGADVDSDFCGGFGDVADGVCVAFEVYPGVYVLGEVASPGYDAVDVSCEEVGSPGGFGLLGLDGGEFDGELDREQFPADESTTVELPEVPGFSVYCQIVNEYTPPPPTTTTTTTTTVPGPTTTATTTTEVPDAGAPTTQGPTTSALDAGAGTLPATGGSSNTGTLAAVALALLLLGAGATGFARRRS